MARGRPRKPGGLRTKSGRLSKSRESLIAAGDMVHQDWAVYFAACDGLMKIGFSGSLAGRTASLSWEQGSSVRIVAAVYVKSEKLARALEKKMHGMFASSRVKGEWFDIGRSDVLEAIRMCRSIGLRTFGGDDATIDHGHRHAELFIISNR